MSRYVTVEKLNRLWMNGILPIKENADSKAAKLTDVKSSDIGDILVLTANGEYTKSGRKIGELANADVVNGLGYTPLDSALKGAVNGVAELDDNGKVPSSQLPSYVDDVIEGYLIGDIFYNTKKDGTYEGEISGETGKIYLDLNTDKTYRWSGSTYVVISETLALGETSSTAYRGDKGKIAYDHSQSAHARVDATKVEASSTNGTVLVDGIEVNVYTHPDTDGEKHVPANGSTNEGKFLRSTGIAGQYEWQDIEDIDIINSLGYTPLDSAKKGNINGIAELDENGKVPAAQLPSFVDDVIEGYYDSENDKFYRYSSFTSEIEGEAGKIYVNLLDNKQYRWSGSTFTIISETLALGELSSTAYRGDRGKIAYEHSQSDHARVDSTKVEASSTNGNVKINGIEAQVYRSESDELVNSKADKLKNTTADQVGNVLILAEDGSYIDSGKKADDIGNANMAEVTMEEYLALSDEEKYDGTVYYIKDGSIDENGNLIQLSLDNLDQVRAKSSADEKIFGFDLMNNASGYTKSIEFTENSASIKGTHLENGTVVEDFFYKLATMNDLSDVSMKLISEAEYEALPDDIKNNTNTIYVVY